MSLIWELLVTGSATASGGSSRDALLGSLAADIDLKLPGVFDIEAVRYKYPVDYSESMNTGAGHLLALLHYFTLHQAVLPIPLHVM